MAGVHSVVDRGKLIVASIASVANAGGGQMSMGGVSISTSSRRS